MHGGRGTNEPVGVRCQLLQRAHFAPEPERLQRAARDHDEAVGIERLLDEVVGATLDRRHRGFDRAMAGDHHHGHVGIFGLDHVEERQSVEAAALEPNVEQHEMRPARLDRRDRLVRVLRGADGVAFVLEDAPYELPNVGFVVNDEDICRHDLCRGHFLVVLFAVLSFRFALLECYFWRVFDRE